MAQIYQEFMVTLRELGKLLLFIIVITNPNQKKIHDQLFDSQTISNQPSIVVYVFEQKKTILKNFYIIFKDYKSIVWTIKYQKCDFLYMNYLSFLF